MKVLSITAGAAGMYCGSCLRDNALAAELLASGHDVTLLPVYTPTNPDELNVSEDRVLFGGISVYLQQHFPLFRKIPTSWHRLWDAPAVIRALTGGSIAVDPKNLGALTVSMLEGDRGVLLKEFEKLRNWLANELRPDVVNLPNALLLGLARPMRDALRCPIFCTLQGEDLFLEQLVEPFRTRAIELVREQARYVDRFIAVSGGYVAKMARLLAVDPTEIAVVPLGINLDGYEARRATPHDGFRIGYFARIAPEKGLHTLAQAFPLFCHQVGGAPVTLEVAGYLARTNGRYLAEIERALKAAGVHDQFRYHGSLDRSGKLLFLQSVDVLSVPTSYDEPKGVFALEAMASGVPIVQPRRGAFIEMIEATGGGLLVEPDNPQALADALYMIWSDPELHRTLSERAFHGARAHYSIRQSAEKLLDVYGSILAAHRHLWD